MAANDTIAGILNLYDANNEKLDVSDLLLAAPLLAILPAKKSSHGTLHKYNKKTTAPSNGFRDVNAGQTNTAGESTQVTVTLKFLDASVRRDIALAKGSGNPDGYMADEAADSLEAAFAGAEAQFINGTNSAAAGFIGLADSAAVDSEYDTMVLDAGGAAGTRNVYGIRAGLNDVCVVYASEDIMMSEAYKAPLVDGSGDAYTALCVDIDAWLGLQVGSAYSVGRIHSLDGTTNHTLTDALLAQLYAKFPAGKKPTHWVMDRTSLLELQASRTATSVTGAPAPFPVESHGVPIVVTDQIDATNTLSTTTTTGA